MNLIFFGAALIAFLEINFPDTQERVKFCNADFECKTIYVERDKFGNMTNETIEKLQWQE